LTAGTVADREEGPLAPGGPDGTFADRDREEGRLDLEEELDGVVALREEGPLAPGGPDGTFADRDREEGRRGSLEEELGRTFADREEGRLALEEPGLPEGEGGLGDTSRVVSGVKEGPPTWGIPASVPEEGSLLLARSASLSAAALSFASLCRAALSSAALRSCAAASIALCSAALRSSIALCLATAVSLAIR